MKCGWICEFRTNSSVGASRPVAAFQDSGFRSFLLQRAQFCVQTTLPSPSGPTDTFATVDLRAADGNPKTTCLCVLRVANITTTCLIHDSVSAVANKRHRLPAPSPQLPLGTLVVLPSSAEVDAFDCTQSAISTGATVSAAPESITVTQTVYISSRSELCKSSPQRVQAVFQLLPFESSFFTTVLPSSSRLSPQSLHTLVVQMDRISRESYPHDSTLDSMSSSTVLSLHESSPNPC